MRAVFGFLAGIAVTSWSLLYAVKYYDERPKPPVVMDTIYYTRFGGVYCGNMEYTSCGIHLFNCGDERDYVCLRDVALKKVRPDEKPAEN